MKTLALAVIVAAFISGQGAGQAHSKPYVLRDGRTVQVPTDVLRSPVESPDGRIVAFIRPLHSSSDDDPPPTEIVLMNVRSGLHRIVLRPGAAAIAPTGFDVFSARQVTFSPDGKRLYVEAACPCTSDEVFEVTIARGGARFFFWGNDISVIRNGPWRGDLLMGVHTCHLRRSFCDYPVHVVRPDGKTIFVVPRSGGADREQVIVRWLRGRRWRAS